MIRRINYTGRLRIRRSDVRIYLYEGPKGSFFDADLTGLRSYRLPPDAEVFVEAYHQTEYRRFSFGRVGNPNPPDERFLTGFSAPSTVLFRVKVVSADTPRKVIAEADRLRLITSKEKEKPRASLLPVRVEDIGDEVCRLDFSGDPVLLINSRFRNHYAVLKHPAFLPLALPAIFREILTRLLLIEHYEADGEDDDPRAAWVRFAARIAGGEYPPVKGDNDALFEWIDRCVDKFARERGLLGMFLQIVQDDQ